MPSAHARSLLQQRPWLLDGPTGTELERRGFQTRLPLWTGLAARDCPELLSRIHADYLQAGADVVTACTFRTSAYSLASAGLASQARSITSQAVAIARDAISHSERHALVAGSVAPLEDCYFPERTPSDLVLEREHHQHIDALVHAGVDLLLIETMPTLRESVIAARIAASTGLPFIVSWVVRHHAQLLDRSPVRDALAALSPLAPDVVAVNCASPDACSEAVTVLAQGQLPFGAYANSGQPDGTFGFAPSPLAADTYAASAASWLARGARMIGGCCGTSVEHIARLRALLDRQAPGAPAKDTP